MRVAYRFAIVVNVIALGITSHAGWAQQTVKATLLPNSIDLATHDVKAGRVTLDVTNAAGNNMEHELVVLKTDLADDALPVSKGQVLEHKLKKIGEVEDIAPGKSRRTSFKLTPGHYVLICNKPGHYEAGMHTALVVTP
ncbi:plastocyanin/azurin family copper-binding protein [Burkholderia sp. MR1-5-21]